MDEMRVLQKRRAHIVIKKESDLDRKLQKESDLYHFHLEGGPHLYFQPRIRRDLGKHNVRLVAHPEVIAISEGAGRGNRHIEQLATEWKRRRYWVPGNW